MTRDHPAIKTIDERIAEATAYWRTHRATAQDIRWTESHILWLEGEVERVNEQKPSFGGEVDWLGLVWGYEEDIRLYKAILAVQEGR